MEGTSSLTSNIVDQSKLYLFQHNDRAFFPPPANQLRGKQPGSTWRPCNARLLRASEHSRRPASQKYSQRYRLITCSVIVCGVIAFWQRLYLLCYSSSSTLRSIHFAIFDHAILRFSCGSSPAVLAWRRSLARNSFKTQL